MTLISRQKFSKEPLNKGNKEDKKPSGRKRKASTFESEITEAEHDETLEVVFSRC